MISDIIRELPCSVSIKRSKPSCFNIRAGGRFFERVHACDEICHRLFRARCQRLLEKGVMNDRIHFHEINADSFECYRKFHLRSLCLLKFFFSGFEDSEHILTPSALYVGLGAGSKAQQFAQMMAIGRKKGVPNKTTALRTPS